MPAVLTPAPTWRAAREGKDTLVPMTQSMYVPGTLASSDKVLVDVGTGYYIEKTVPEAESFFQRKVWATQPSGKGLGWHTVAIWPAHPPHPRLPRSRPPPQIEYVQGNADKIEEIIMQKRKMAQQVLSVMQQKVKAQAEAQGQSKASA